MNSKDKKISQNNNNREKKEDLKNGQEINTTKKKTTKNSKLNINSSVRGCNIKLYAEQLPDELSENEFEKFKELVTNFNKKEFEIYAIVHDKDYVGNFFTPELSKPHIHIVVRRKDRNTFRIKSVFQMLNILERPEDENMWKNGGIENLKSIKSSIYYLLHKTNASEADGKHFYDDNEVFTNQPRLFKNFLKSVKPGHKYKSYELAEFDEEAYDLGKKHKDFDDWVYSLPFEIRSNSTAIKTFEKSYMRGVEDFIKTNPIIDRVCIFITGGANIGKSYVCHNYKGKKMVISGSRNNTDRLTPSVEALFVNDATVPDLLNLADGYPVEVNKRYAKGGNPYFLGNLFVVMSNLSFDTWLAECGIYMPEHQMAAKTRFCVVELDNEGYLIKCAYATRGTIEKQNKINQRCVKFLEYMFKSFEEYREMNKNCTKLEDISLPDSWFKKQNKPY